MASIPAYNLGCGFVYLFFDAWVTVVFWPPGRIGWILLLILNTPLLLVIALLSFDAWGKHEMTKGERRARASLSTTNERDVRTNRTSDAVTNGFTATSDWQNEVINLSRFYGREISPEEYDAGMRWSAKPGCIYYWRQRQFCFEGEIVSRWPILPSAIH